MVYKRISYTEPMCVYIYIYQYVYIYKYIWLSVIYIKVCLSVCVRHMQSPLQLVVKCSAPFCFNVLIVDRP
jgi:hypothetical protein